MLKSPQRLRHISRVAKKGRSIELGMVEGRRKFTCDRCGAVFDSRDRLALHTRTHAQRSTVTCSICGTSLRDRPELLEHLRLVHRM